MIREHSLRHFGLEPSIPDDPEQAVSEKQLPIPLGRRYLTPARGSRDPKFRLEGLDGAV